MSFVSLNDASYREWNLKMPDSCEIIFAFIGHYYFHISNACQRFPFFIWEFLMKMYFSAREFGLPIFCSLLIDMSVYNKFTQFTQNIVWILENRFILRSLFRMSHRDARECELSISSEHNGILTNR